MPQHTESRAVAFCRLAAEILALLSLGYIAASWDVSLQPCLLLTASVAFFAVALLLQVAAKDKEIAALRQRLQSANRDE